MSKKELIRENENLRERFENSDELMKQEQERAEKTVEELQKRIEETVDSLRILEAIMEYIPEGITIADAPDGKIRMISKYGQELIRLTNKGIEHISTPEQQEKCQVCYPDSKIKATTEEQPLSRAIRHGEIVKNEEWMIRGAGREEIMILCNAGPIKDKNGKITGGIMAWRDINELKRMEDVIKRQAYHDFLTSLPNRLLFMDHLTLALTEAQRNREMVAVMYLDLDRFKNINDSLGHAAGDQMLKYVAARLKACIRKSDTIARIGGDEFTILMPHITHAEDASKIAKKILSFLQQPYVVEDHALHVTPSIGISIYPSDSEHADTLLKYADTAMYHVKKQGRNNYQFYNSDMNMSTLERMILENSLLQTLKRGELVVYYQPQVNIDTRQIICAEALVRWQNPTLGLLDPVQFLPLAEETGFIIPLDEWVLRTACAQNKAWQEAGFPPMRVTVNLSARQFKKRDLAETVSQVLRETELNPEFLELEISENTAMHDIELTTPNLVKLTDMGIRFSIDDFGTGYSSLSYLKKLPIQKLKIDKSFISGLSADPDYKTIVNAVIAMAHNLNLKVVAEGVETEDQLSFLHSSQCDGMQGYLFSEPLPAKEFKELMLSHSR